MSGKEEKKRNGTRGNSGGVPNGWDELNVYFDSEDKS